MFYYRDRTRILWNRFFSGKARMDTVNGWFNIETGYGYRGIGCFLEKQEWILYMYGLIETRYGYSGMRLFLEKEGWILYIIVMFYRNSICIRSNRISSGKPKMDPVHVWNYRVKIWIQWNRIFFWKTQIGWFNRDRIWIQWNRTFL